MTDTITNQVPTIILPSDPELCLGALTTPSGPLPLRAGDYTGEIDLTGGTVRLVQDFHNPYTTDLEVTYTFPLPNRAAVTGFVATLGTRRIEGILQERSQARAAYDEAIAAGSRAAIAEQERSDVFTVRIGNIAPGEDATVELSFFNPLVIEDGIATFRLPTTLAPRYTTGTHSYDTPASDHPHTKAVDTDAVPDASRLDTPRYSPNDPRPRFSLSLTIAAPFTKGSLVSTLHATTDISTTTGPTQISLSPDQALDCDFILRFTLPTTLVTEAMFTDDPTDPDTDPDPEAATEGTWSITLLPPPPTSTQPRQVVIVLDRSGSMGGWKMLAARRAACRIVDSLSPADSFAVLGFDNTVETPPGQTGLTPASDVNRFAATSWLSALEARGGTEMHRPLLAAADLLTDTTAQPSIILVTDGQISGEDHLLSTLAPKLGSTRVHTVGIDRAVNAGFLERLAKLGSGTTTLVESQERLDEVMATLHRRVVAPLLTDVTVSSQTPDFTLDPATTTPSRRPDVYEGLPCVVNGRYARTTATPPILTVTAQGPTGPVSYRLVAQPTTNKATTTRWARSAIAELEDAYALSHDPATSARIVGISIAHGVLSRFTAFVAIDPTTREITDPQSVSQPSEYPSGWGGTTLNALSLSGPIGNTSKMRSASAVGSYSSNHADTFAGSSSLTSSLGVAPVLNVTLPAGDTTTSAPGSWQYDAKGIVPALPTSDIDALNASLGALSALLITFGHSELSLDQATALAAQVRTTRSILTAYRAATPSLHPSVVGALDKLAETLNQLLAATSPTRRLRNILAERIAIASHALTTPPQRSETRSFWA